MKHTVSAYAKINLFLDIESVREDGYHNILSLMQSVSLHDTVTVEYIPTDEKKITISCSDTAVPCNEKNLAFKAAAIFPINHGTINIDIQKMIPMQAGLAGGSTDAAATLISLNEITGKPLSLDELKTLGNTLGADVPFCIEPGASIARGTGNILEKAVSMPRLPIVIARMGDGMSTPEAYRSLDRMYNRFTDYRVKSDLLKTLLSNSACEDVSKYTTGLFNIFESVVEPCRPAVTEIKREMTAHGALAAMMSGSGTSVFGIFKNEIDANRSIDELKNAGAVAYLCYPIG